MATKSKKYKNYQMKWKVFSVIVLCICALSMFFCGIVFKNISANWSHDILEWESYYDTPEFYKTFYEALDDAILADIFYGSEERIQLGEVVDHDDLIEGFKRYYGIIDGIITGSTMINNTYDGLTVFNEIPPSLRANFDEYVGLIETRLPLYRKMYIQNQLDEYKNVTRDISRLVNFVYIIEDEQGNVIAGNSNQREMDQMERTFVVSAGGVSDNLSRNEVVSLAYENVIMEENEYKLYAAVKDPLLSGDAFYEEGQEFGFARQSLPIVMGGVGASLLVAAICFIHLVRTCGQKEKGGEVTYLAIDEIYNEVQFILIAMFTLFSYIIASELIPHIFGGVTTFWSYTFITILAVLYMFGVVFGLTYILSVARQVKGGVFLKNTWVSVTILRMADLFTGKTFRGWLVIVMLFYAIGNCVVMGIAVLSAEMRYYGISLLFCLILLLFNILCICFFMRALRSLKRIMISARETSKGNFYYQLELSQISPSFINFASDVANIQDGLKKAVEEAVKGERMKTELITNVSHDLKTPLTSIITYADLLRKEELHNDHAKTYVEVLHEKSYRLKNLIEDLIEASKASSGNLSVTYTCVDYRQLVLQAIGEMEENIVSAGLEFKISCDERILIRADGGHMWRILENILTNAVKYSMENSRVYADIFESGGCGVLVMKNVSAAAIDFDATRLAERFVRGDSSRTTEGSGLGLSITQSLTEIQGGAFGIEVDGDLFKAIVRIPLWIGEVVDDGEEDMFVSMQGGK